MSTWVNQLPPQVRAEIRRDAYRINSEWYGEEFEDVVGMSMEELIEDVVMCERLCNIAGRECDGMLDAEKYSRWI